MERWGKENRMRKWKAKHRSSCCFSQPQREFPSLYPSESSRSQPFQPQFKLSECRGCLFRSDHLCCSPRRHGVNYPVRNTWITVPPDPGATWDVCYYIWIPEMRHEGSQQTWLSDGVFLHVVECYLVPSMKSWQGYIHCLSDLQKVPMYHLLVFVSLNILHLSKK